MSRQWCTVKIAKRRVERRVAERQRLRVGPDDGGRVRRTLGDHRGRRLDRDDLALRRLVASRAGADVDDPAGIAERGVHLCRDARVRATRCAV